MRVDVDRELDVRERVHDPVLVADLRLGLLERAREDVARAARVGAVVAVEERADGVVPVQVDTERVPVRRRRAVAGARGRAVAGHVAALGLEVVQRVVPAVGVDRRHDEDVEVVDELLRLRIGRVVAHEPLARLHARDRGDPLTRVLLAVDEHADLRAVADLADAQRLHLERAALDVGRGVQPVRHRHARTRLRDAGAGVTANGVRTQFRGCVRVRVDRRDDLRRRARERAGVVRGQADRQVIAAHRHRQRRIRGAGVHELRRELVAAEVTHGHRLERHRLGPRSGPERAGLARVREVGRADDGRRLALVAARQMRQVDLLGDVRELRREGVEPGVDLGRVHVVVKEVLLEPGHVRRERLAQPRRDRGLVHAALVGRHADLDRIGARRHRLQMPVVHVLAGVGVPRRVPVTAERHRERHCGAEDAVGAGARHRQVRRGRRRGGAELGVRLDVEELARVVRERVRAHDHDLAGRVHERLAAALDAARRDPVLGELVREPLAAQPRLPLSRDRSDRLARDRLADRVARRAKLGDLVVVVDDDDRRPVPGLVTHVVVVHQPVDRLGVRRADLDQPRIIRNEVLGCRLPSPEYEEHR